MDKFKDLRKQIRKFFLGVRIFIKFCRINRGYNGYSRILQ